MQYLTFDHDYDKKQEDRIAAVAKRIREREAAVSQGYVVPESDDIPIHTGRRLEAAVMFIDMVGSSSWPGNSVAEQEKLLNMLAYFFCEMFRIISDYGGDIEKNTGDGLMAYFADGGGNPSAPGVHRAVSCAMTMRRTYEKFLRNHIEEYLGKSVDYRATLDYGPITVARIGAPKQFNGLVAIGVSANIASKLQSLTSGGQIVIGNDVFTRLPEQWKKFAKPLGVPTGFSYLPEGRPYEAFLFDASWRRES